MKVGETQAITASVDVFNLINFQEITERSERYTSSDVVPIVEGKTGDLGRLRGIDGNLIQKREINPNFSNPTAYQQPRQIKFGLRGTF